MASLSVLCDKEMRIYLTPEPRYLLFSEPRHYHFAVPTTDVEPVGFVPRDVSKSQSSDDALEVGRWALYREEHQPIAATSTERQTISFTSTTSPTKLILILIVVLILAQLSTSEPTKHGSYLFAHCETARVSSSCSPRCCTLHLLQHKVYHLKVAQVFTSHRTSHPSSGAHHLLYCFFSF